MITYTTPSIEKKQLSIKEEVKNTPNFPIAMKNQFDEMIKRYEDDFDYIGKYDILSMYYADIAKKYLIAKDTQNFKGYCYLSGKSAQICVLLYEKGKRTYMSLTNESLETRKNVFHYAQWALMANSNDVALYITLEDSLLGSLIIKDYEKAKKYLPENIDDIKSKSFIDEMLWSIAYGDEKIFNRYLEKRIKMLRRQKRQGLTSYYYFDEFGLALTKLAITRGLECHVNVAELPWELLDDESINEEIWKLPEDKEVEKILTA